MGCGGGVLRAYGMRRTRWRVPLLAMSVLSHAPLAAPYAMARNAASHDLSPVLGAARHWLDTCLIGDGSVFTAESLWTASNLEALRVAFVEQPDTSADDFMTKLLRQTVRLSPQVKRLTAEVVWALLLFPSNIAADTKRAHIRPPESHTMRCSRNSGFEFHLGSRCARRPVAPGQGHRNENLTCPDALCRNR